ncbi:MAG: biotin--[acetyl-CoA-carboxylase] ligase [Armatimonadota bacterium]
MMPIRIHHFNTVTSTNDVALDMARVGAPEGSIVLARSQSAGRGRQGRAWLDEPGACVLMSAIVRPALPQERVYEISFVASAAVAGILESRFGLEPALKWPNDVLVHGRKIGGILIEAQSTGAVVIGIGLNVNQRHFPPQIKDTATSVAIETGSTYDTVAVGECAAQVLMEQYRDYLKRGFEEILSHWRKYMWGVGREASVETDGRNIRGTILGVDSSGALLVREPLGKTHAVYSADAVRLLSM